MGQLDNAIIGNCQISALLDKEARYVWLCLPRFDSPSVFAALLGGGEAGAWSLLPDSGGYETKQRYLRNTNVVQTEFHLRNGDRYDVFDFAPRFPDAYGSYYRAPQCIRILRPIKGNPRVRMELRPRFEYGSKVPEFAFSSDGVIYRTEGARLVLQTDISASYVVSGQPFELSSTKYCVLSYGEPLDRPLKFGCEEFYDRTVSYWRTWVKHCNIPFEYQEEVIRSALALKLHIFEDTGAIIAATTTSIPESPEGSRTWDYRYCWLRDAYFVINALNQLGQFDEMERFIGYLHNIAVTEPGAELQPVYGIGGERELTEIILPWLDGFRGMGPVRIGNAAYLHPQYDVYGEMVLAVMPIFFDRRIDRVDLQRAFENVILLVERAIPLFDKPDAGIWEFRGERRHYLFSKLMCWAAVDRGLRVADRLGKGSEFAHWREAAVRMRATIEREGWNEDKGYYAQTFGGSAADASGLLMGPLKFHPPEDQRYRRTVTRLEEELMSRGYVFRYRDPDDFGVPIHAFTVCTYWMVDALTSIGRYDDARAIFQRLLSRANHVGLLSEDVDPATGELWGNFPQTYSHVGLINSAFHLSKSWSEAT